MTDEEVEELSRCKTFTLKDDERGELAIKQSRALVRTFKKMKDYIVSNEIFDNFISTKTLQLLAHAKDGVKFVQQASSYQINKMSIKKPPF